MFNHLHEARKDIKECKATLKCGNDTGGIAGNRIDRKEEFRNISQRAKEGDQDKEVDRYRGQRTESLWSDNTCS